MKISKHRHLNFYVFEVEGSLSCENMRLVKSELESCLKKELSALVKMSGLYFIDSASLGMMLAMSDAYREISLKLACLCNRKDLVQLVSMIDVHKKLPVFDMFERASLYLSN